MSAPLEREEGINLRVIIAARIPGIGLQNATCCSIECARHHGFEPVRLPIGDEYNDPCVFCGEMDGGE